MGIFNYIDSFFFISLGITFILILLLVFHFKQRISVIEQKNDTMFEIINNVVKEIVQIKTTFLTSSLSINNSNNIPLKLKENPILINETIYFDNNNNANKIIVSDSSVNDDNNDEYSIDESENEEDYESETEDESEEDGESESDTEDESEDEDGIDSEDESESEENNVIEESKDTLVTNSNNNENNNSEEIKLINVEDNLNNQLINTENIIIEKIIDEKSNEENDEKINKNENKESLIEIYRKMNIQTLKAMVISKGLMSDPSKMKKVELLKLIENNLDELL